MGDRQLVPEPAYKRILLKMSGEALAGDTLNSESAIDSGMLDYYAQEIEHVKSHNVEIAVVIGGGNIWRGNRAIERGMDEAQSHYMGMLATIINALALQDALERRGIFTRAMTAIQMNEVAEPFIRRRAIRHMEKGRVIILAAGTGNPYFTTDSALPCVQLKCMLTLFLWQRMALMASIPLIRA